MEGTEASSDAAAPAGASHGAAVVDAAGGNGRMDLLAMAAAVDADSSPTAQNSGKRKRGGTFAAVLDAQDPDASDDDEENEAYAGATGYPRDDEEDASDEDEG